MTMSENDTQRASGGVLVRAFLHLTIANQRFLSTRQPVCREQLPDTLSNWVFIVPFVNVTLFRDPKILLSSLQMILTWLSHSLEDKRVVKDFLSYI